MCFVQRIQLSSTYKVALLLCVKLCFCIALPISSVSVETSGRSVGASQLVSFLRRFGYLGNNAGNISNTSASNSDHDMLYTQASVEEAIKQMQKFGALKQTGQLDNETIALITRPRCGTPDIAATEFVEGRTRSKRYVIGASGWKKRRISYRVENWAPELDESAVLLDLRKAFDVWAAYARLQFSNIPRLSREDEADISISFGSGYHGDTYPFDGSGGILAHAFFPYGHGSLGGDIHFDVDENWSSSSNGRKHEPESDASENKVSFLSVAIHEIGHSLSHSPSRDSVMFPYYQGWGEENIENVRLGHDDIMAMYKLYIQREIEDFGDSYDTDFSTPSSVPGHSTTQVNVPSTTTDSYEVTTRTNQPFTSSTSKTTEVDGDHKAPDICQDGYDTISFMRNELFVFKGKYMWRFKDRQFAEPIYPVLSSRLFPMLLDVTNIDAAFENDEGQLFFFSGKYYWKYDGTTNRNQFPLTDFGLPEDIDKVDAAFIWGKNRKLYFFRYNTSNKSVDEGYPKGVERWRGLPASGINSALKWSDGLTYFFKNDDFWRFDDIQVHTEEGFPMKTSSYWFGC